MSRLKFFLNAFSSVIVLVTGVAALDPDDALTNYTDISQEILNISDPFDRLDLFIKDFAEDIFESTGNISEMLMNGPLGELANGSMTPWLPSGGTKVTLVRLLSSGLPYLKQLSRNFKFISDHIDFVYYFGGLRALWKVDWCTAAITLDLSKLVRDVSETLYFMGGTSEGVSLAVYLFESDHKPTSYDWLGSESFAYYVEIVDRMLDRMYALFGPNCSDINARDIDMYYLNPNGTEFKCETSDPCLHKFLLRYSNYSERVYSKFIDVTGKTLFFALNLYGLSLPIAGDALSAGKKAKATATVRSISTRLKLAFWDDGGKDSSGEKDRISSATVASEYWPDTAVLAAKEAFGSELATWPSPEAPTEFYAIAGERIQNNLSEKLAFRKWFSYSVAVYWPAKGPGEHCIQNLTKDVFYELGYNNANYFVSRTGGVRNESDLEKAWRRISGSGTETKFMESSKQDLCDRVKELSSSLSQPLLDMDGFRSLLAVQCARKFVWYELGYHYFHAVWASHQYVMNVQKAKYSRNCASIVLFP